MSILTTDFGLLIELQTLYTECASALDEADFERFLACFAGECSYSIRAKENVDRGWPIAFVSCVNRAMLVDRISAIRKSSFIIPRLQRRIVSGVRLLSTDGPAIRAQASFSVFETFENQMTTLFVVGRYHDEIRREQGALRFVDRRCVLDSSIVPNSLPYPL